METHIGLDSVSSAGILSQHGEGKEERGKGSAEHSAFECLLCAGSAERSDLIAFYVLCLRQLPFHLLSTAKCYITWRLSMEPYFLSVDPKKKVLVLKAKGPYPPLSDKPQCFVHWPMS